MTFPLDALHAADRRFVDDLARRLDQPGEQVFASLLAAERSDADAGDGGADRGAIRTRVVDGRFVALSLRELGPALRLGLAAADAPLELPFALLDALSALDVAGLQLDVLELEGLAQLEVLRCADNRLTHLEPGGAPGLVALDCSGNRLMLLDLRRNSELRTLDCSGNQVSAFLFPARGRLEVLRCARNELLVLDLGEQPHLVELSCFRNPLLGLQLAEAPRLRTLDCARCELTELPLSATPGLESLDCARNRLGALDLSSCPSLRRLAADGNYVELLDLRLHPELREVRCRGNQLRELRLASHPALDLLDCGDNRLRTLDVSGCPRLAELACDGNELGALDLRGNGALCAVDAHGNALRTVALGAAGLARLRLQDNDLARLDVTEQAELCELSVDDGVEVRATEAQQHRLGALRRRQGEPVARDPAAMDPWELHELARSVDGPDAEARLLEVVRNPRCDLGTALMVYWMAAPHYYLRYGHRDEVEGYERPGWDLVTEIEQRVAEGFYSRSEIWFDPRNDKQTRSVRGYDWTREVREPRWPVRRQIPARMMAPSKPQP